MAITSDDLRDFQLFASQQLGGENSLSLVELASQWEAQRQADQRQADQRQADQRREAEETLADIRASHTEIDAGSIIPVADAFAEVRQQLGLG